MGWQTIRGHDAVRRAFQTAWQRGRLGHAYLFVGPAGIGKRLFARELARSLLCERRGDELAACGECPACRLTAADTHPDLFTAGRPEGATELPIEAIRELCGSLALKPARGGHKIAIVDDADDLNDAAANCFLKTLEEPPPASLLILVGTGAERQLPTIVSRCQVVRFAPLSPADCAELLTARGIEPKRAGQLARLAGGSVGAAVELDDPELWAFRGKLIRGLTADRPDPVGLAQGWVEFAKDGGRDRARLALRLLIDWLRAAVAVSAGAAPTAADPGDVPLLESFARRVGDGGVLALLDRCLEADSQIDRNAQLPLVLEALTGAFVGRDPARASAKSG